MPYRRRARRRRRPACDRGLQAQSATLGAAGLERPHEVRCLGRHVETRTDHACREVAFPLEALTNGRSTGMCMSADDVQHALGCE